jgi:hypothetical protein
MEMQTSLVRSTAPELNGCEGVSSLGQGATPSSGEAPQHAHGEGGGVWWLNGVVENRGGTWR